MCKPMNEIRSVEEWAEVIQRGQAVTYLLTQMIRVTSPELKEKQQAIMMLFSSTLEDGGCDGVNSVVDDFVEAVLAKKEEWLQQQAAPLEL